MQWRLSEPTLPYPILLRRNISGGRQDGSPGKGACLIWGWNSPNHLDTWTEVT